MPAESAGAAGRPLIASVAALAAGVLDWAGGSLDAGSTSRCPPDVEAAVPLPLIAGAQTMCSFGLAPSTLMVTPEKRVMVENRPVANITDIKPFVNILPFGLCTSLANPITAAQTAAALGVLTPGVCTPVTVTPWLPGAPTALSGPAPTAHQGCTCMCAYGGVITVVNPGATRTMVG